MASSSNGERLYRVEFSGMIEQELRELLRQAVWQGRGPQFREALRKVFHHLVRQPNELGEPLYRLTNLRLHVRHVAVGPLVIHFAVHENYPLVFIKSVALLPNE
jgi:hypothetical protein